MIKKIKKEKKGKKEERKRKPKKKKSGRTKIKNTQPKIQLTRVPKGMAAEDCSAHRIRFMTKKTAKTIPGQRCAVNRTLDFHFSPPYILYMRADT